MGEDWVPVHHATLVFVCAHDRVLLIRKKRGLGAGKINGPGGKLDPGETPHQCAVREVQEELHITPLNLAPHGELKFQFIDDYSIHVHVFLADSYDGEPTETDEALPLWFAPQSIPYDEMWADDAIWLPRVLEGAVVAGRFVFDGDCMLEHEVGYT
jgi:8-oxo-dGTP diphosphatase